MTLYYTGVDLYGDVSVNYCVHEMFAEKQANTLVIRFNDAKGTWSKWQPAEGDTVQFKAMLGRNQMFLWRNSVSIRMDTVIF